MAASFAAATAARGDERSVAATQSDQRVQQRERAERNGEQDVPGDADEDG